MSLGGLNGPLPSIPAPSLGPGGLASTPPPAPAGASGFTLQGPLDAQAALAAKVSPAGPLRAGAQARGTMAVDPSAAPDSVRAIRPGGPARLAGPAGAAGPAGPAGSKGPLRAQGSEGITNEVGRVIAELRSDERRLDRFVRQAARGGPMDPAELLSMQALVYRYSQRVDLLAKLVERLTGAVRQTLQTQL